MVSQPYDAATASATTPDAAAPSGADRGDPQQRVHHSRHAVRAQSRFDTLYTPTTPSAATASCSHSEVVMPSAIAGEGDDRGGQSGTDSGGDVLSCSGRTSR